MGRETRPNLQETHADNVRMETPRNDQRNTTARVVGDNRRLLNQNPTEFSYTWQSSSVATMAHEQHNPQIYVNCCGISRDRGDHGQEQEGEITHPGQRPFTNL